MATLPRSSPKRKTGSSVSVPFSTSPRQFPEMTFNIADGHDVTSASGISVKQYEEQLVALRKENFHLKLRIYFLEEKLGSGSPPSAQGLLEHNVRLQVEVAELRRQLAEKQELLAAAAQAIDVLEQQGSTSTDSVDASIENTNILNKDTQIFEIDQTCKTEDATGLTCEDNEIAVNHVSTTAVSGLDTEDELSRLQLENAKALQMIKSCAKTMKQQERELKKLRLLCQQEPQMKIESNPEKFEEVIKCKDNYIKDLEAKIKQMQLSIENATIDNSGNVQELLTKRLQGLACFLDKLLSHKCVLGEDKKNLAQSILEQSIALSTDLKIDRTMAPEEFSIDESNFDMSQSLRLEDLTMMFGHHGSRGADVGADRGHVSESEGWSEPDRNVSLARIGLDADLAPVPSRRVRHSHSSRSDDNRHGHGDHLLHQRVERLEQDKAHLAALLDAAQRQIEQLTEERNKLNEIITAERANVVEANKTATLSHQTLLATEEKVKSIEKQLATAIQTAEKLRAEKRDLETNFAETETALRRAADEATVEASEAVLERVREQHERLRVERELEETRDRLAASLDKYTELQVELVRRRTDGSLPARDPAVAPPSPPRPASPDQGIDSDRLDSLDHNELSLSPRSLYEENVTLKQKLARSKATLADALNQLNAANQRKVRVQRAICREIHKTHGVLRLARDQFEGNTEK